MIRQVLLGIAFVFGANILRRFTPPEWDFTFGALWGIAMVYALEYVGQVEAKRRERLRETEIG